MKLFILSLFLFIGINGAEAKIFSAKEFLLKNGLKVVVVKNNKAPLVAQYLCYHVGRIDEAKGKSGLAHLLEHMMFKGSGFSEKIDRLGGEDNAFTTNDMTCYYQKVSAKNLETIMAMESSRMRGLSFSPKDFADEKKVVIEERVERTESKPAGLFFENMAKLFYEDTPYSVPTIGFLEEIKGLSSKDLKSFYDTWYHPNNAVLAISGDVDALKVEALAKKYYGKFKAVKLPKRVALNTKILNKNYAQKYEMKHKNTNQPSMVLRFHAPCYANASDKKYLYALDVFSEIVGGGTIGKLYQELVVNKKLLLNVSASYSFSQRLAGEFTVYAVPAPDYDKEKITAEIMKILDADVTDKEIDRVRNRMKYDRIYLAEKPLSGAELLAPLRVNGMKLADIENYDKNLYTFTKEELNQYKKELLKNPLEGWLLPND